MQWSDEAIAMLKKLWLEGYSGSEIGKHMGCSRNAIIGKIHRLGLGQNGRKKRPDNKVPPPKPGKMPILFRSKPIKKMVVKPEVPKPVEAPPVVPLYIPLVELENSQCHAIVEHNAGGARYCGHATVKDTSWCEYHFEQYTQPAKVRR